MNILESLDNSLTEASLKDIAKSLVNTFKITWNNIFPSTDDLISWISTNERYFSSVQPLIRDKTLHEEDERKGIFDTISKLKPNAIIMAVILMLAKANGISIASPNELIKGIKLKGIDTTAIKQELKKNTNDFTNNLFAAFAQQGRDAISKELGGKPEVKDTTKKM